MLEVPPSTATAISSSGKICGQEISHEDQGWEWARETLSCFVQVLQPFCLGSQWGMRSVGKWLPCSQQHTAGSVRAETCVSVKRLWSCFSAQPPHSNYHTIGGWRRSEQRTSWTCHHWYSAAACFAVVTNNLFNFASNVFLASFIRNYWQVKFSWQLCKYGIILLASWCYFAFGSQSLSVGACNLKYLGKALCHRWVSMQSS